MFLFLLARLSTGYVPIRQGKMIPHLRMTLRRTAAVSPRGGLEKPLSHLIGTKQDGEGKSLQSR
jgi:hypothetical protein